MYQAFCDESGDSRIHLCVAGYVAKPDTWHDFSRAWNRKLNQEGLAALHMVEHVKKVSSKKMIEYLIDLIVDAVDFGCAVSICPVEYELNTTPRFRSQKGSAYSFCLQQYAAEVFDSLARLDCDEKVAFIADRGHKNQRQVEMELAKMNNPLLRREFGWESFQCASDDHLPPLQAADLLAHQRVAYYWAQRQSGSADVPYLARLKRKRHRFFHIDAQHIYALVSEYGHACEISAASKRRRWKNRRQ